MKKSIVVLLHIGFWVCYLLLIIIMVAIFYRSNSHLHDQSPVIANAFKNLLLFACLPSAISFYLCYFLLFPQYIQRKKFVLAGLYGVLIAFVAAVSGYVLHRYLINSGHVFDMDKRGDSTPLEVIVFMAFIASISGVIALVIKGCIAGFDEMKLKEALQSKNHETEMALVKAQLDPHFLFNTLNNIDVLILKDAEQASGYLNKLSDILRFMLYETKVDKILLSKEIEYIEKYMELQKIRTSNANYINFQVKGNVTNKTIAPMVFIPFIENAFKHTTNKKLDRAIEVNITIENEKIIFLCENKFDSNRKLNQESNGLGNDLIQKRLNLIYPEKHRLVITSQGGHYSVHLMIYHG